MYFKGSKELDSTLTHSVRNVLVDESLQGENLHLGLIESGALFVESDRDHRVCTKKVVQIHCPVFSWRRGGLTGELYGGEGLEEVLQLR